LSLTDQLIFFRDAKGNPIDPNTWNYMEPRDLLNPRVFLCKAGRFIENVVKKNMHTKDDTPYVKETYINENFQATKLYFNITFVLCFL